MNTPRPSIPPALFAPQSLPIATGTARDPLAMARTALLGPAGLDEDSIARILGDVMGHAVDYADLYFQLIREESWALEDGIVKDGAHSIEQGVGVRALAGEKTGFAYSDEIVLPALLEAAHAARAIARSGPAARCRPGARRAVTGSTCRSIRSRRWTTAPRCACSRRSTARHARWIRASSR